MRADHILVFAPHPDDEIIGCGGTLALACAKGAKVKVIVVTNGEKGILSDHSPQIRKEECITGLEILGIEDAEFWGYPDGAIPLSGSIIENYRRSVSELRPDCIFLPSPSEVHADHRRVTRGILKALEGLWQGQLFFYETTQPILINTTRAITSVIELKRLALMAHASQMEQFNYEELCISLNRLRGLSIGTEHAEGFLSFPWDGSGQNFFETRPLISVVVRADNLLYLRNALLSLIAQNYDQIDVILVWHGDATPNLREFDYLDIHFIEGTDQRSRNLNLGITQADGEYLAVLDQDDILYPDHFELLLSHVHGNNNIDIVYSGCKVLHCEMKEGKSIVISEERVFNRPYQPGRILIGNYIPFHSILFRSMIFHSHRFDEDLSAYEDWEMISRLEMSEYHFSHIDAITCEYRLYSQSDYSLERIHVTKGYASEYIKVLKKGFKKMEIKNLEQLSELIVKNELRINELESLLEKQKEQVTVIEKKLEEYDSVERLLLKGMTAARIDGDIQNGLKEMLGRVITDTPLFSIILPICNTPADILEETFQSIRQQKFKGWELCLVDDASDHEETLAVMNYLKQDRFFNERLYFKRHKKKSGIVNALTSAVSMAKCPYILFLDHDDLLHEDALLHLALIIKTGKEYSFLYTDSRTIDLTGNPMYVYHKPDWSPENLLHSNYINHLVVIQRKIFNDIGGFRKEYEGAQDLDLLLRLTGALKDEDVRHIGQPLYDWRATSESLAYSSAAKPYVPESARKAIENHLTVRGLRNTEVKNNTGGAGFQCSWKPSDKKIDILIPTTNNLTGLKSIVEGLLQATDYPETCIIIAAANSTSEMLKYLNSFQKKGRIKVVKSKEQYNWSILCNRALKLSSSPYVLFLHDDIEIKDRNWLKEMSKYLLLEGVGAVGATLLYPDGSLQHNGIMTDPQFVARNITTWGQRREFSNTRNVSAVSGSCILLRRDTIERIGGLDESLPLYYNDVDLCLNIRNQGLRIVQAVDVQLFHFDEDIDVLTDKAKKAENREASAEFMRRKWGEILKDRYRSSYEMFAQYTKIIKIDR
jgi:LmbE family N-acetylglucosaminyl deacetylase/glycosyltransferase involved in cell wall biosynthesis